MEAKDYRAKGLRNACGTKWFLPRRYPQTEIWANKHMDRVSPRQLVWMEKPIVESEPVAISETVEEEKFELEG